MRCRQHPAPEKIINFVNIHAACMMFFRFSLDIFSRLVCDGSVPVFTRRPGSSPFHRRLSELAV
jgi:hypothetical protein